MRDRAITSSWHRAPGASGRGRRTGSRDGTSPSSTSDMRACPKSGGGRRAPALSSTEPRRGSGVDGQPQLNLHVLGELTATRDGAVVDLGGRRQRAVLAALAMQRDQVGDGGPPRRLRVGRPPTRERARGAAGVRQPPAPAARARRDRPPAGRRHRARRAGLRAAARHRKPWTRGPSRPRSSRRRARRRGTRCARWRPRCGCGADRRTPTTRGRRGPRRRSPGSPSCAAVARERLLGDAARARRGPARHRRPRGAGQGGPAARGALAAADARALPLPPPGSRARGAAPGTRRCSPTSSASTRVPRCARSRRRCSPSRPTSTGRRPQRPRTRPTLIPRPRTPDGLVDRDDELAAPEGEARRPGRRDVRLPAGRGPRRHRQDAPARRAAQAGGQQPASACGRRGAARWSRASSGAWSGSCSGPAVDDVVASDERFAALRGLCELTTQLAEEAPFVLCVDDVQRCDEASLQFLAYLVRRLEGLPVLVVLAMRTGEQQQADDLAELVAGRDGGRRTPRAAHRAGDRRAGDRPARSRRRRVRRDLPPDDLGQPAAPAPAAARPGGPGRPAGRGPRRHRPGRGVARDHLARDPPPASHARGGHDGRASGRDARADGRPA